MAQFHFVITLSLTVAALTYGLVIPITNDGSENQQPPTAEIKVVEHYEKIGGSILKNPFPVPTIVRSIHLEQVQISDQLLAEMLANCLKVEGFHFRAFVPDDYDNENENDEQDFNGLAAKKSVDADYTFDLALITHMQDHRFQHFILDEVTVNFNAPSPIKVEILVTFYESTLPSDFTTQLATQFPSVNTLNLASVDIKDVGHGISANDLEYLLSGAIPTLRHMYIRDFNLGDDGGSRLQSIFAGLGCPGVKSYVFLDKDFDHWEC